MKAWQVTVTFRTQAGVTVTRTLPPLRDQFRSAAIGRGIATGIPAKAIVVNATARPVGR
jgi:hypothetical protein